MGLWTFYPQDGVPQWAVEVIVAAANVDVWEVIDVVEEEVNRGVMFVVVQS